MLVVLLVTAKTIQRRFSKAAQVFVTGVALDRAFRVCIAQDKFGAVVIKTPLGGFPLLLGVAVTTFLPQRRVVLVVLLMASQAILGGFLEHVALVTLFALGLGMFSEQRKTGRGVVKLRRLLPALFRVATCAILAQRFLVFIVLLVAGVALLGEFDCCVEFAGMTRHALGVDMLAAQQVLGVGIVVENGVLPQLGAVASLAFFAKLALVALLFVVLAVTANTGAGGFTIVGVFVTFRAFHVHVLASEWKARRVVIKLGFLPCIFTVAAGTFWSKCGFMHIILFVTRRAIPGCLAKLLAAYMALVAFRLLVFSQKREVGDGVIKLLGLQRHHARATPLVLGMAGATGLWLALAVESGFAAHINTDFLMAVHAQAILSFAVELHMALAALVLPLRVTLNEFARCHDGLNALRPGAHVSEQS